jgi:hypothetical protein
MSIEQLIEIRPYTLKGLAAIYGVHPDTMRVWLNRLSPLIGDKTGYYYNITQVKIIFRQLSLPSYVKVNEYY